jgi:type II secretory pathway component PulJ
MKMISQLIISLLILAIGLAYTYMGFVKTWKSVQDIKRQQSQIEELANSIFPDEEKEKIPANFVF